MNPAASQRAVGPKLLSLEVELEGMKSAGACDATTGEMRDMRCEIRVAWNHGIMMGVYG